MQRQEAMCVALDDWYPCFPGNMVQVSFMLLRDGKYRVCVWGADDCGMERDFDEQAPAQVLFTKLTKAAFIDRAMCISFGMVNA
jgi:hypothetical protein